MRYVDYFSNRHAALDRTFCGPISLNMKSFHRLPSLNSPAIMGIINVTPDSFSDGGRFLTEEVVVARVAEMIQAGADIIDIGGESSRPFSQPVSPEQELQRVIPAIRAIRQHFEVPVSIDTTKATVARAALEAGANIINDISSFQFDPQMLGVAADSGVPVIIMHMQGRPRDMQIKPEYQDVVTEIINFLQERITWAEARGLPRERLIVDPGIGFGKTVDHNFSIIQRLSELLTLGCPVLVGHSRKAFIGKTLGIDSPDERDEASATISAFCAANGAAILRVHDVRRTAQAIRLQQAIAMAS
jgi:dihydropteroate synthase